MNAILQALFALVPFSTDLLDVADRLKTDHNRRSVALSILRDVTLILSSSLSLWLGIYATRCQGRNSSGQCTSPVLSQAVKIFFSLAVDGLPGLQVYASPSLLSESDYS